MRDEFRASPTVEWDTSYSQKHRKLSDYIDKTINQYADSVDNAESIAVVGPYGSGKTQFVYELFRRSWRQGIPAVYVDFQYVIDQYKQASTDKSFSNWVVDKISKQANKIIDGEDAEWAPEFPSEKSKKEFREQYIDDADLLDDRYTLLVDEVEQEYKILNEEIGTDDENPLRDTLDKLRPVLNVWCFGLVSAYEILGEADIRRFTDEKRIPVMDIKSTREQFEDSSLPDSLVNGIWWLSRGRTGWAAKISKIASGSGDWQSSFDSAFESFIKGVSKVEYHGTDAIQESWIEVGTDNLMDAQKTLTFCEPAHRNWICDSGKAISVTDAHGTMVDSIREINDPSIGAHEIIRDHSKTILQSICPTDNWVKTEGEYTLYLPIVLFIRPERLEALLSVISGFVRSYERSGNEREEAAEILDHADAERLADKLASEMGWEEREKIGLEHKPWTVEPEQVIDTYQPLSLNPSELTGKQTEELKERIKTPIQYYPDVSIQRASLEVQLCPTKEAYEDVWTDLESHHDIGKKTVILLPDSEEAQDWDAPTHIDRLQTHSLVEKQHVGGRKLWNFVIHLEHYISDVLEKDINWSRESIRDDVTQETQKGYHRNIIHSLIGELHRHVQEVSERAKNDYLNRYSRNGRRPIWSEDELQRTKPFFGYTGRFADVKEAVTYQILLSTRRIDEFIDTGRLVSKIKEAYSGGLMGEERKKDFGYIYYLRQAFRNDGSYSDLIDDRREIYLTPDKDLIDSLQNTQLALSFLMKSAKEDGYSEAEEFLPPVLDLSDEEVFNPTGSRTKTPAFLAGIYLKAVVDRNQSEVQEKYKKTQQRLENVGEDVSDLLEELQYIDNSLSETSSDDDYVTIEIEDLENVKDNIEAVREVYHNLYTQCRKLRDATAPAAAIWVFVEAYADVMSRRVKDLNDAIAPTDIAPNISKLNSLIKELERWNRSTDAFDYTDVEQEKFEKKLKLIEETAFDIQDRFRWNTIPLDQLDRLDKINEWLQGNIDSLKNLHELSEEIDDKAKERDQIKLELTDDLLEFREKLQWEEESV